MGYLVIKNGSTRKSYLCTNTCNKPRVKVSNSYIPLTGNNKSGVKCKISSSNIAEYNSYTYTGNQGTITTGTTYQTRASTYNTVYGTSTYKSYEVHYTTFTNNSITGTYERGVTNQTETTATQSYPVQLNYVVSTEHDYIIYSRTIYTLSHNVAYITKYNGGSIGSCNCFVSTILTYGTAVGTYENFYANREYNKSVASVALKSTTTAHVITGQYGAGKDITVNAYNFSIYKGTINDGYITYTITTGTTYQTRASTYNTLYGTKTTNKTLTSSSWG